MFRFLRYFSKTKANHCRSCYATKGAEIENRQKEMMARGLPKKKHISGVKQVLVVASGKGGVGKSTTAVNLAVSLKLLFPNKSIGLLDADIFGPSVPLMMNINDTPLLSKDNLMVPLINYGVSCMSMGFLVDEKSPVIWRGLMVMSALDKLLRQVDWGSLDYLIVDTPPGTGDTQLSLIQNVPIAGVLLVTTPQEAALQVTRRGAIMFKKLDVPIVGIVGNMSSVVCPSCHHVSSLFGDKTKKFASELGITLLQEIPLDPAISESSDSGKPIVVTNPKCFQTAAYKSLADKVARFLETQVAREESQK